MGDNANVGIGVGADFDILCFKLDIIELIE